MNGPRAWLGAGRATPVVAACNKKARAWRALEELRETRQLFFATTVFASVLDFDLAALAVRFAALSSAAFAVAGVASSAFAFVEEAFRGWQPN